MRAFVGLPCPDPWIGPLIRVQSRLPGGRRVDADDLHVTLAFLDDQPEETLETLHDVLETRPLPAATLRALAYVALGTVPRAVVLDLASDAGLTALHDAVRGATRQAGLTLPRTRFRPHITLTRHSRSAPADTGRLPGILTRIGAPDLAPQAALAATLWASTLTPDGPIYEPMASYRIAA